MYGWLPILILLLSSVGFPTSGLAVERWRILAIRVSFPVENPDDRTTSGDGTFDLRPFEDAVVDYRFPFDTPPHDRAYFDAHLQALANYYREVSQGQIEIEYEVYPLDPNGSYVLSSPLKEYGNGRTRQEINERVTRLFRDGIVAADSTEGDDLDFSRFRAFAVFHPGLGGESGQALNDVPSAFVSRRDLDRYGDGPIPAGGGSQTVSGGMLLPEAISGDGRGGLNGTLARFFASQLGLPGLSNFEDDLPAVGDWSLMDTGANNFTSAARLGLSGLKGDAADTVLVGYIPSRMMAWSRIQLGWLTPDIVAHDDTLLIAAPYIRSNLPQAVAVPISANEYFLLENRVSRLALHGEVPQIAFSRPDGGGVWLSVDDYDSFIPGSGLLIWHVDEAVIRASDEDHSINSHPRYCIAFGQYRRGISLEEADGAEDIGNVSSSRVIQDGIISFSQIEGGRSDPYAVGNGTRFGPDTVPGSRSNLGYVTGVTIEALSPPGDTVAVKISFGLQRDAWPVTGLPPVPGQSPRAVDLDGDGVKEILRSAGGDGAPVSLSEFPLSIAGVPVRLGGDPPFNFRATRTPAVGELDGGVSDGLEFVWANGDSVSTWWRGQAIAQRITWLVSPAPTISAAPVIGEFSGDQPIDIWGWSHGQLVWGEVSGMLPGGTPRGTAALGEGPVVGLAAGDIDSDGATEVIALTGSGTLYAVESNGDVRPLGAAGGSPVGPPVVADLDRDGADDVFVLLDDGATTIFGGSGLVVRSEALPGGAASPPIVGDLDGDGFIEVLFGGQGRLWAVRFNGVLQTEAPFDLPLKDEAGPLEAPPVLVDLDGDGEVEILAGTRGGLLYGLKANGEPMPGFPLSAPGPIRTAPLVDDLDGDGTLEVVVFTEDGAVHLRHLEEVDPSYTGNRVVWGQLGGGPGNAGRLLQTPEADPPGTSADLLPPGRVYCYPNPIRESSAYLRFFLGDEAQIQVVVLNAIGEVVDRMSFDNPVARTDNEVRWNTEGYASGLYICRVEAISEGRSEVRFVKAAVIR